MENINNEVLFELRKMNKLLTLMALESKPPKERVSFLSQLGLTYSEIGQLIDMKPNAVRMAIQRASKGKYNG